jgi:hypothetical protein
MRTNGVSLTLVALVAAGLCVAGTKLTANAQNGQDSKKNADFAPPAGDVAPNTPDVTGPKKRDGAQARKPDTAMQRKLRGELDDLLKQRADLDRRIAETRGKLGETGRSHQRIELRTGDGPPQVFEFDGDGNGAIPPGARKQMDEARKRIQDTFGNLPFGDMPMFDFQFDAGPNGQGVPDMKAFRDRMQKWQQDFQNRMQRRFNDDDAPVPGDKKAKPDKDAPKKLKTLDA